MTLSIVTTVSIPPRTEPGVCPQLRPAALAVTGPSMVTRAHLGGWHLEVDKELALGESLKSSIAI